MFNSTIQVVLQRPTAGGLICRCFSGIPSVSPALITVLAAGGASADQVAALASNAIENALQICAPGVRLVDAPCGPQSLGPVNCHAHTEPNCRRILVLVFDGTPNSSDPHGAIGFWASRLYVDPHFSVILGFPLSVQAQAGNLIPNPFKKANACFWRRDPSELALPVLAAAGVGDEDYRLFISYRRGEGQALAEQLFDELNRRNFEVFLDQFRINPGWNFQERLTEELAHKSMIVVLETANITQSQWITHEVTYAIRNRLGILAIQPPGGASRPEIGNRRRVFMVNRSMNNDGTIKQPWLDRVCAQIRILHSLAIVRKRHQMQQAMRNALLYESIYAVQTTFDGFLEVTPGASAAGVNELWLTPRPADLAEFQMAHGRIVAASPKRPAVIAPAALLPGRRRAAMEWLGGATGIHFRDESEITSIAQEIKAGGL
jgi:TIR domain